MSRAWTEAFLLCLALSICCGEIAQAQGKHLKRASEAKQEVDEVKSYEKKQKEELAKKITKRREETLEKLKGMERRYKEKGDHREARAVKNMIRKLKAQIQSEIEGREIKPEVESEIVEFDKEYLFQNRSIKGRITFMKNGKVNAIYMLSGESKNEVWDYTEKDDHLSLKSDGLLGHVYVSEVPKSDKQSVLIRFGGKLKHVVLTAK